MPVPSTFSIAAYDSEENAWGVAVASKFLAVGAVVSWAEAGVGAVATQAHANTSFGPRGLALMRSGLSAVETLERLRADDPQIDKRQVGLVDARGGSASFTGADCFEWAGGRTGPGFAIQGNILTGPEVVEAMQAAYTAAAGSGNTFTWRLHAALLAGDRAGGDRRGRQSAAILVVKPQGGYGGFNDRWIDYRVDDHPDPVVRLGELLALRDLYFEKSPPEDQVTLRGEPLSRLQVILSQRGYYSGLAHGEYDAATRQALDAFIGADNFEERFDPGQVWLHRPVLEHIYEKI